MKKRGARQVDDGRVRLVPRRPKASPARLQKPADDAEGAREDDGPDFRRVPALDEYAAPDKNERFTRGEPNSSVPPNVARGVAKDERRALPQSASDVARVLRVAAEEHRRLPRDMALVRFDRVASQRALD